MRLLANSKQLPDPQAIRYHVHRSGPQSTALAGHACGSLHFPDESPDESAELALGSIGNIVVAVNLLPG